MKKTILALAAVALLGTTLAQEDLSLAFSDADFPYYDLDKGYVNFSLDGDTLTVNLRSDAANGVELEFVEKIKQPTGEEAGEAAGAGDEATYSQRDLRERAGVEVARRTVELTHQDARLNDVIDRYSAMLSELGFVRSVNTIYPNTRVYLFDHQGQLLRVFFTRVGDEVRVRLTTAI